MSSLSIDISCGFWSQLSPSNLGPVSKDVKLLYNYWEFSAVYSEEINAEGLPNEKFFKTQTKGFSSYIPCQKKQKAMFTFYFFNNQKYSYLKAMHDIFIPCYVKLVKETKAWKELVNVYRKNKFSITFKEKEKKLDLLKEYWNSKKVFSCELILLSLLEKRLSFSGNWIYEKQQREKQEKREPSYYYGKMYDFMVDEEIFQNLSHGLTKYAYERILTSHYSTIQNKLQKVLNKWIKKDKCTNDFFSSRATKMFDSIINRSSKRAFAMIL